MAKRGRPRRQNVKRAKDGRISRKQADNHENVEPIGVRMRMFSLSEKDARDQKSQSAHGRMYLRKKITIEQYDAGEMLFKERQAYLKALKAPDALANGTGSGGDMGETPEYEEWAKKAIAKYDAAMLAIQKAQEAYRLANLHGAIYNMLYLNQYHEHLEGDFSIGLRVLSVHYGLTKKSGTDSLDEILRSQRCA